MRRLLSPIRRLIAMQQFIFFMATISQLCMHVRSAAQGQYLPRMYKSHTVAGENNLRTPFSVNVDRVMDAADIRVFSIGDIPE